MNIMNIITKVKEKMVARLAPGELVAHARYGKYVYGETDSPYASTTRVHVEYEGRTLVFHLFGQQVVSISVPGSTEYYGVGMLSGSDRTVHTRLQRDLSKEVTG